MELIYKRATPNDWLVTSSIEKRVSDGKTFKTFTEEKEARDYLNTSKVFIIYDKDKPIGTVSYEDKGPDHAYIDALTIIPDYQGQGLGSKALEWLLNEIGQRKLIDLVTHPLNSKAVCTYLKHGFIIKSWKDNYFGDGEPRPTLVKET